MFQEKGREAVRNGSQAKVLILHCSIGIHAHGHRKVDLYTGWAHTQWLQKRIDFPLIWSDLLLFLSLYGIFLLI